jgi:stage V sporulation protein B
VSDGDAGTRRGALAIAAAKAWFLVAGLAQNVVTPIAIGQEGFGTFKRALAFVNVLNNVVVVASIQGVSRAVAGVPPEARGATLMRALRLHVAIGACFCGLLLALVPLVVAHQHAPQIAAPLRWLAVILVAYGVYAPLVGALNGVGAFGRQAALDATYSTLRTLLIAGVGAWFVHAQISGGGPVGASLGFVATAIVILPAAWLAVPRGTGAPAKLEVGPYLTFLLGLAVMQFFQSAILQIDIVLFGRMATMRALAAGLDDATARATADRLSGLYAQAQAFGLVPYQILLAAAYVLFPAIAAARARQDDAAIRDRVARGGRTTLVATGAVVAAIAGTPIGLLRFAFGHGDAIDVASAAPVLRHLALGHGATAIAMVGVTLFAAAGRARRAAGLSAVVFVLATIGAAVAGGLASNADAHLGAMLSLGLAIGLAIGATIVALSVRRAYTTFLPLASLARVAFALVVALVIGPLLPTPSMRAACAVLPLVPLLLYAIVVTALGEPVLQWIRGARGSSP